MKAATVHALILALFTVATTAWAVDSRDQSTDAPADPALENARAAVARKDWTGAQGILREALAKNAANADYHNLYAYANRMGASPSMDLVFKHYNEALRIDSKHRGAHEYIGEAYLMVGNLSKAKEHLQALDRLCFFGCEEFSMLKNAVAEHEAKQKK